MSQNNNNNTSLLHQTGMVDGGANQTTPDHDAQTDNRHAHHNNHASNNNIINSSYNLRSPAVKRILLEAKELSESTYEYHARPLEDNIFEWHFTVRGANESDFENGFYHGRIVLPSEYPMKPPSIILLTPNGRFELNQKICLSISGHHPETWMPSWSIRTVLLAIISFMPTKPEGHIGAINYSPEERKRLAKKSHHWKCPQCGLIKNLLKHHHQQQQQHNTPTPEASITSAPSGDQISTSDITQPNQHNAQQHDNDDDDSQMISTPGTDSTTNPTSTNQASQQPHLQQQTTATPTASSNNTSNMTIIIFYYTIVFLIAVLLFRRLLWHYFNQHLQHNSGSDDNHDHDHHATTPFPDLQHHEL